LCLYFLIASWEKQVGEWVGIALAFGKYPSTRAAFLNTVHFRNTAISLYILSELESWYTITTNSL